MKRRVSILAADPLRSRPRAAARLLVCVLLLCPDAHAQAADAAPPALPHSFTQAKQILSRRIHADNTDRRTFYCGCRYSEAGLIDAASCGYVPRREDSRRAARLEWEHIVPASFIGKGRACWDRGHDACISRTGRAYKGRRCCEKTDPEFRAISADLHNLVPEIGELNADRRDFPHREIEGEDRQYGQCDFEVDAARKAAEPAEPLRGFIGRTWLYMSETYRLTLPEEDRAVYEAWADAYPPDAWEMQRRSRIETTLRAQAKHRR